MEYLIRQDGLLDKSLTVFLFLAFSSIGFLNSIGLGSLIISMCTLEAMAENFKTCNVSSKRYGDWLTLTIIEAFPKPVKKDWNSLVSFESLKGTICCFLVSLMVWLCRMALMTLPRTKRLVLMFPASFWRSPVFNVFLMRSLPARSQNDNIQTLPSCGFSMSTGGKEKNN